MSHIQAYTHTTKVTNRQTHIQSIATALKCAVTPEYAVLEGKKKKNHNAPKSG